MSGKTKKKLTVKEIREIEPKTNVYELDSHCKYIINIEKSSIALNQNADLMSQAQNIMKIMKAYNLPCAIMIGADNIKFLELKGELE